MSKLTMAVAAALLVTVAYAASWETPSFRSTNGEVVRIGMTRAEVVKLAGPPADKTVISHGIATADQVGLTHEDWTYRLADGIYTLTFAGTKLEKIEVTPAR